MRHDILTILLLVLIALPAVAAYNTAFSLSPGSSINVPEAQNASSYTKVHVYNRSALIYGITINTAGGQAYSTCGAYQSKPFSYRNQPSQATRYNGTFSGDTCIFTTPLLADVGQNFYIGLKTNDTTNAVQAAALPINASNFSITGTFLDNYTMATSGACNALAQPELPGCIIALKSILYTTPTSALFPYNVTQLDGSETSATDMISAGFAGVGGTYRYAVACNVNPNYLFVYNLKTGFNFTGSTAYVDNVVTSVPNPNDYLTFNGWTVPFTVNTTFWPSVDFFPSNFTGAVETQATLYLDFMVNDSEYSFLVYDLGGAGDLGDLATDELALSRNGNTLTVEDWLPGGAKTFIGNATISGDIINLSVSYSHERDPSTLQNYFTRTVSVAGSVFTGTDTRAHPGSRIRRFAFGPSVVWYGVNETTKYVTIRRAAMTYGNNLYPDFIEFENPIVYNVTPCVYNPADPLGCYRSPDASSYFRSNDFTVILGRNSTFFSVCQYPAAGLYTQRHYIAPPGTDDYTNYRDLTVNVESTPTQTVCIGGTDCINGVCAGRDCVYVAPPTPAAPTAAENLFGNLGLGSLGFLVSSTGLFILAILISIGGGVAVIKWSKSETMGGIAFLALLIIGVAIHWVPIWVVILLAILAGGILAYTYRAAIGG